MPLLMGATWGVRYGSAAGTCRGPAGMRFWPLLQAAKGPAGIGQPLPLLAQRIAAAMTLLAPGM